MTTVVLDNDEKINLINQHIRSLRFSEYNADLDLIEANAAGSPEAAILAEINSRKTVVAAKIAALIAEKTPLEEE